MNSTAQEMKRESGTHIDGEAEMHKGSGMQSGSGTSGSSTQGSKPQQQSEGAVARTIEEQTSKLPSDLFLWGAIGGMAASALLQLTGHKDKSRFFGQWVAPIMLFGVYNKIVKTQGSDRASA